MLRSRHEVHSDSSSSVLMMTSPRPQQKSHSEQWPILQHFRELQPELSPLFIRDLIYVWEKGRRILLKDSEAGL